VFKWLAALKQTSPFTPPTLSKSYINQERSQPSLWLNGTDGKAVTVAALCDLYLAEGVSHKKALTLVSDRARIENHIKPLLGRRRLDQVTRADVERLLTDVKAGDGNRVRTGEASARQFRPWRCRGGGAAHHAAAGHQIRFRSQAAAAGGQCNGIPNSLVFKPKWTGILALLRACVAGTERNARIAWTRYPAFGPVGARIAMTLGGR